MNTSGGRLFACFFSLAIDCLVFACLGFLLIFALLLLGLDLSALLVIALALVGKLLVLDGDLLFPSCGIATSTSAVVGLATIRTNSRLVLHVPKLHVDLATFLLLGVREHGVMVLHQRGLHVVVALELDETAAHGLAGVLVCAKADFEGLELGEMLFDLLFRGAEGKIACGAVSKVSAAVK